MEDFFIIIALIFLNGLFAMSEIALISARKTSLSNDANKGNKSAQCALKYLWFLKKKFKHSLHPLYSRI